MCHIEESRSPIESRSTVETVMEEIISPEIHVIKVKVEKGADEEEEYVPYKPKKNKINDETERKGGSDAEASTSSRLDESTITSPRGSALSRVHQ